VYKSSSSKLPYYIDIIYKRVKKYIKVFSKLGIIIIYAGSLFNSNKIKEL
jgi:hypothetical protein